MLVLPLCGFSPEEPGGAGGGDLLLAGHTDWIKAAWYAVFLYLHRFKKDVSMMCRIQNLFSNKLLYNLQIPRYIRQ